jgi:hypothetical protein
MNPVCPSISIEACSDDATQLALAEQGAANLQARAADPTGGDGIRPLVSETHLDTAAAGLPDQPTSPRS